MNIVHILPLPKSSITYWVSEFQKGNKEHIEVRIIKTNLIICN